MEGTGGTQIPGLGNIQGNVFGGFNKTVDWINAQRVQ